MSSVVGELHASQCAPVSANSLVCAFAGGNPSLRYATFAKYVIGTYVGGCNLPTLSGRAINLMKVITKEDLQIGQIISFKDPFTERYAVVKRVIALGPCDLVRNGKTHRVPEGFMWVEGDNKKAFDSRFYGPISTDLVIAKMVAGLYPLKFDLRKRN